MDMAVYYTFELARIQMSAGASALVRQEIETEIGLRVSDPTRDPGYRQEEEKPVRRRRRHSENND